MPARDPDKRRQCGICHGPIFVDEPGARCPECVRVLAMMHAAHHREPGPEPGPRLGRAARPVRIRLER